MLAPVRMAFLTTLVSIFSLGHLNSLSLMFTVVDPSQSSALRQRLERLTPESVRQWGTPTPPEMLRHLFDSFQAVTGARGASARDSWASRTIFKWLALYVRLPWPKGYPTLPELDPKRGGSSPGDFAADKNALATWIRRVGESPRSVAWTRHPGFGELSRWEWARWSYLHVDHHLRQFGL